ncbi:Sperm-associated antigen 1 [Habropoda laboriosa]|uniref:Sperm-associated antigen 1 n=1 Tax=Habropoda laboriosa TaxID=597456 RepID=A0A0L7QLM9_9HYME|nr:Sperm-associated antigen 1 [Habropoda laboriosa]
MVENDTDIVRNAKSKKKSLLERYDVPVEHLSYEYISECTNGKKMERIVTILRSGEEGCYPDLTRHAEERLAVIKPTSALLKTSEPILMRNMLLPNERKELDKDINDWTTEMQIREKDLEEGKNILTDTLPQPDIRQFNEESIKKNDVTNSKNTSQSKRIVSCDYAAWDKYDVDTELNKIDIRDEQVQVKAKRFQQKQKETVEKKKLEKHTIIDKSSLTGTELDVMAEQEREKGNEAFRAGDYEEALEHYNTSIKMNSSLVAYNNRAMTYIKLRRYVNALHDCNKVLSVEYTNIKALLRRAITFEHLEKPSQALENYEAVLKLEPTNAVAIAGVKKLRKPCESRKIRMTIEEQTEDMNEEPKLNKIEEKRIYSSQIDSKLNRANSICYCDRAPGPSQNLRPRPHLKADYCLDNENKLAATIKTDVSKKSETDRGKNTSETFKNPTFSPNNRSSNLTKLVQEQNNSTVKQKSIFSYTMPPRQTNSVIIEELPSESKNNSSANVKAISNETVANKNNSNTKSNSKSKVSDDKQVKSSNYTLSSPRKIEVADKYENKTSKEEKYFPKVCNNFNNIENGYEFMRTWRSLQNDTDLIVHAQLLRSLNIDKLSSVLGNELDGNMFSTILRCLEQHFCTSNDRELLNNFLKSFSQVKRFSIVNMFMNTEDKRVVKNILNFLEEHGMSEVSSLRQIYCI